MSNQTPEYDNSKREEALRQLDCPNGEVTYPDASDSPESSGFFFYSCADGASNSPCPEHFPGQPEMPADWMTTYSPGATPGTSDRLAAGASQPQ